MCAKLKQNNSLKINTESISNVTGYKLEALTDKDVISEAKVTLEEMIRQAYEHALKEGIKANTVILDEHFCKVNGFDFLLCGYDFKSLPPMICGLEIRGISKGEMPPGYNFAVLEAHMTEREALIRDTRRGIIHRIREELHNACIYVNDYPNDTYAVTKDAVDKILNNLLEELCYDNSTDESSGS